jgi:hypothetical protein
MSQYDVYKIGLPFGYKIGFHWRLMKPGYFRWLHPSSYFFYHGWQAVAVRPLRYPDYEIAFGWRVKVLWFHFGRQITLRVDVDE